MKKNCLLRSAIVVLCAVCTLVGVIGGYRVPGAHASTGPIPLNCNRACLENLVDQYLAALGAHDPKRLPLSADVTYTENDQVLEVGAIAREAADLPVYPSLIRPAINPRICGSNRFRRPSGPLGKR